MVVVGAGFGWWWQSREKPRLEPVPPAPVAEAPPAPPAAPPEPQVRYPIEKARPGSNAPQIPNPLPALDQSDKLVQSLLVDLLGRQPVRKFLRIEDLVRHVVSTVDSLPNSKAAVRLWPVNPTVGNLVIDGEGDNQALSAHNYPRYEPFVRFVESIDTGKAVALYVELYPLFQKAYEDLGYPNRHFNDRLVEVIDHLLETPEVAGPIQLARPGVVYEYADEEIEERSAGQKILIRMGPENTARLKAKLRDVRQQVTSG
jgi:hypothetical protein